MTPNETHEEWLIAQAKSSIKSDPFAAKAWLVTAKTLFPRNFSVQVYHVLSVHLMKFCNLDLPLSLSIEKAQDMTWLIDYNLRLSALHLHTYWVPKLKETWCLFVWKKKIPNNAVTSQSSIVLIVLVTNLNNEHVRARKLWGHSIVWRCFGDKHENLEWDLDTLLWSYTPAFLKGVFSGFYQLN